jgi:glycosyltransferase involved in cell wall biosynthesis
VTADHAVCRIGILQPEFQAWTAGPKYIRTLVHCLALASKKSRAELFFLSEQEGENGTPNLPSGVTRLLSRRPSFRGERRLRQFLGLPKASDHHYCARKYGMSVVLPCMSAAPQFSPVRTIGWIPDFQHVYIPEFFSEPIRRYRDQAFRRLARRSTLVILSSQIALRQFAEFAPESAHKGRAVSFPSMFGFESPNGDPRCSQRKFHLPEKFVLVANQFWRHKNHLLVIAALERLRCRGIRIPVVMTGLPLDKREAENETVSQILQAVASSGLSDQVTVLGLVPETDLNNLMRCAALIIQPSRFEGWSTVVQEAKALGRPLFCSDIPVHHEQVPTSLGFFPCDSPNVLADLLADHWHRLKPGPDSEHEEKALAVEQEFAETQGQLLLNVCLEANSL